MIKKNGMESKRCFEYFEYDNRCITHPRTDVTYVLALFKRLLMSVSAVFLSNF